MAGAGKKTFTAGEVLTASDVNTYLMEQSVMVFGGTAARASAIPTPSTGMTSYIGVTGTASIPQIETYTGSAWQTPYGLTLVGQTSFSAVGNIVFNNVFTSAYENYKLMIEISNASAGNLVAVRMRSGGTDNSSTNYNGQISQRTTNNASWTLYAGASSTYMECFNTNAGVGGSGYVDIFGPATSAYTTFLGYGMQRSSSVSTGLLAAYNTSTMSVTTAYDGFNIFPLSGTLTGTIRVYGYRNS
jgi:hypothetical protein